MLSERVLLIGFGSADNEVAVAVIISFLRGKEASVFQVTNIYCGLIYCSPVLHTIKCTGLDTLLGDKNNLHFYPQERK
jgi:hypothetical protein